MDEEFKKGHQSKVEGGQSSGKTGSSSFNEYATISAQSTSKNPALQRLLNLQQVEKKTWGGIKCEYTGRPGTSLILNAKR